VIANGRAGRLLELAVDDLALIDRLRLSFAAGLNVLTGETGAGKTVLAHALDLLLGGRARTGIVRPGAPEAYVEGVFEVGSEDVVLARRVGADGRTRAYVNGRSAAVGDLRELADGLLSFYGQHEHRKLTIASAQMEVLDGFAGAEHLKLREDYREAHRECLRLGTELAELRERDGSRERDLDLYRYELSEIEEVGPDPAEEAELIADRDRLRHAEGLREATGGAREAAIGAEEDGAESLLQGVGGVDADLDALTARLGAVAIELGDVAAELHAYLDGLEADPGRLAAVEERLDALDRLRRKHGGSAESVLAHAERCRAEIAKLEGAEERGAEAEAALAAAEARRAKLAARLSKARAKAVAPLEREAAEELERLAMPGAKLEVALEPHSDGFGPNGAETVELRLAPNPGLEPAALRDAASGGELSRVMLALSGFGGAAGAGTLVFDEIDAGVGGKTARAVGERLRALGENRQVLCITHLPQVASLAETHFTLEKDVSGDRATAGVRRLDGEAVVEEISRMLGGERSDDAASRHARELLAAA
jgi:DNA repair protein RecN (Recombination protein N)